MESGKIGAFILLIFFAATSCKVSERPIEYGSDECVYCKMTIMDHRYGSELVTSKGKVYTFDAAECLIDYLHYNEEMIAEAEHLLITPYTDPDHLSDATLAIYLVSVNMPSPMGAYLTAFSEPDSARNYQARHGGEIYDWEILFRDFRSIKREVINKAYE